MATTDGSIGVDQSKTVISPVGAEDTDGRELMYELALAPDALSAHTSKLPLAPRPK
jgi:hypothetical protein